jgi:hypothetical protein
VRGAPGLGISIGRGRKRVQRGCGMSVKLFVEKVFDSGEQTA